MQQRTPTQRIASAQSALGLDFDARLERGPLRVRAQWTDAQTRGLERQVRDRRRKRLLQRLSAVLVCFCSMLYALLRLRG